MHQAGAVRGSQPSACLIEPSQQTATVGRGTGQLVAQGAALDQLHGEKHLFAKLTHVEYADDVRVNHLRERLRLSQEPSSQLVAREVMSDVDEFECDVAIELRVVSP